MMAFQPSPHGMHPMGPGGPMGPMPPQGHHMPGHPGAQMHPQMAHPQMPPHVSQPGMMQAMQLQGPNAHAMSHPGHPNQPMFPSQMGQGFPQMTPQHQAAMMQMQQRQRMIQMQQQMQQQQQQQVNPQMMNPQAMHAAMQQQGMRVNLPTSMQSMQTPNNHEMQQRNAMMQQQHQRMAMQNAMPPGSQGPPMPGPQSTPMRPQQSMQSLHESTGGQTPQQQSQQVPGQTSGPGPQQTPQPQNQPRPPQAQQAPPPQPTPQPAQTPQQQPQSVPAQQQAQQQQPQSQQQAQQQAQQNQGPNQAQNQSQQTPQQQQAQAREQEQKNLIQAQQNNANRFANMVSGPRAAAMQQTMQARAQQQQAVATARLLYFCERLASIDTSSADIGPWQELVRSWFTDDATFGMHLWDAEQDDRKMFEIPQATLARYFWIQHKGGVQKMQINLSHCHQRILPNSQICVESPQMTVTYVFENGAKLVCNGTLNAVLDNATNKFDWLEFFFEKHEETIPSTAILKKLQMESPLMSTKSPKLTKTPAKNKAQKPGRTVTLLESEIPRAPVQANGVTDGVARFLEMMETMSHMRELFDFSHQHADLTPNNALERWVEQHSQQMQAPGFQQPLPPGMRTPGQMGNGPANYFPSPGHMNLNLPNATSSPLMRAGASPGQPPNMHGQSGMTAPGSQAMVAQLSQQGSNSAGSNNASPNVTTKKRRASQVKMEGDDMKKNKMQAKRQKN